MEYLVPLQRVELIEKKLQAIANKCKKYGCTFEYEFLEERLVNVSFVNKRKVKCALIKVSGIAIINGWQFICCLEHTPKGNIVRSVVEYELPNDFKALQPYCEHCKTNHYRKNTYIVKNVANGEYKQLGSSCLKLYTNGLDSELVAQYENALVFLEQENFVVGGNYEREYFNNGGSYCYDKESAIKLIYNFVKNNGYNKDTFCNNFDIDKETETTEDLTILYQWANGLNTYCNDYNNNVKICFALDTIEPKHIKIIASAINRYLNEMVNSQNTNFVGNVGERITIEINNAKLLFKKVYEYGWASYTTTNVYKVLDNNGNIYKVAYKGELTNGLTIKATIKNHTIYNGEKQTELTRAAIC